MNLSSALICIYLAFISASCFAQTKTKAYKNYKFEWDSTLRVNYIVDTLSNQKMKIDFRSCPKDRCWFVHGFVLVRIGDQKALMDLNGKKILTPSHLIRFNPRDSIISAFVCEKRTWIFLNFYGDTLSIGRYSSNNYIPSLTHALNLQACINEEGTESHYGYLNKKAEWQIEPKYQNATPFRNGCAKVVIDHKWGAINSAGEWVIPPQFDNENFHIYDILYNSIQPLLYNALFTF